MTGFSTSSAICSPPRADFWTSRRSTAPFRLVEGVSRLCGLMSDSSSRHQELLGRLKTIIDRDKFTMMTDAEAFKRLLDNAVLEFTRSMKAGGDTEPSLK